MSKIVVQDAVPFVPNGGQLYYFDPVGEPIPVADEVAKKLIRQGVVIIALHAGRESYRAVLKRIGFSYAEVIGEGSTGMDIKVRTGRIRQEPVPWGPGVAYKYMEE